MVTDRAGGGALAGVRVVELAHERVALAGRVLADLGAEVILVEPPGGSPLRHRPPFTGDGDTGDRASLYWAAVALGKRSIVLDIEDANGRGRLRDLVRGADVLLEANEPGGLDALGLGYGQLCSTHPRLIYVSVTPYGQSGPDAHSPATDLTVEAAGGLVGLQGDGDRPPVPVGFPQASFHAGVQAAADAIIALNARERTGRGQHLDVSMQAAAVWTLMNATGYPPNTGGDPPGTGAQRAAPRPEPVPGISLSLLWPCADGYVYGALGLGALGGATLHGLLHRGAELGILPDALAGRDWRLWLQEVQSGTLDADLARTALAVAAEVFARSTKQELVSLAVAQGLLIAPIATTADLLADEQLCARDYWQTIDGRVYPGPFACLSRTPIHLSRGAPAIGEYDAEMRAEQPAAPRAGAQMRGAWERVAVSSVSRAAGRAEPWPVSETALAAQAFAGLKVADFAWVGVGPITSKALADHGATVVHVETAARPDILRTLPPFKDGQPGIDRGQFMPNFNSSKLGLALNLGTEQGRDLARRLVAWADVVVESFTPGTMQKWGLDYDSLSRGRPDLVMLSTCLRGQTGPHRSFGGFGGQGAALAGIHGITGWPDRPPCGPWGAYTDFIAPRYAVSALAAALLHRSRTGEGQHIDLSQVEAGIHFIEPLVLDHTVNGRVAAPAGHDSPYACPHGVYPAAGTERYVAIAVETAAQWRSLYAVMALDAFADAACDDLAARQRARPALDAALAAWTCERDAWELVRQLKAVGVPAAVVARPSDLYEDPQLASRGFFVPLEHSVMGRTPYDGPATIFSETSARLSRPGPCLGEHTFEVLTDLLGLTADEVAGYAEAGVLT